MAGFTKGRTKPSKRVKERLDYHEGLSSNQVKIVLTELGLNIDEFNEWLYGQTAPVIVRYNEKGQEEKVGGVYEYDLLRYIQSKRTGIPPIFD